MNNRKRTGHKVSAGTAIQEFYDNSRNSLRVLPLKEEGWLAIRRPSKTIEYSHLENTEFCVVTNLSQEYKAVAYWFKNLDSTLRSYVGAIVSFKGTLSLNTNYTVIYVLRDGTLIHDMRNHVWATSEYVDMASKIEYEYELSMHVKTLERHKRVLIKVADDDEDVIVYAAATGSRQIGKVDERGYHSLGPEGVRVDDDGVPLERVRKPVSATVVKPQEDEPVSLEPWKEFLKNNVKVENGELAPVELEVLKEQTITDSLLTEVTGLKNTIIELTAKIEHHETLESKYVDMINNLELREKILLNALQKVRNMLND